MNECPECGGPVWDNRPRKRDGRMKANAPDFACRDKDGCGWKKWPPKGKKPQQAATSGPKWTWKTLAGTYDKCLQLAAAKVPAHVEGFTSADVVAAAATLFIAVSRDGVAPLKRAPEPEPEPEPPPPDEPWDEEDQDDLPF